MLKKIEFLMNTREKMLREKLTNLDKRHLSNCTACTNKKWDYLGFTCGENDNECKKNKLNKYIQLENLKTIICQTQIKLKPNQADDAQTNNRWLRHRVFGFAKNNKQRS